MTFRHIVLDLDATLLTGATQVHGTTPDGLIENDYMYLRPGAVKFVQKCFDAFDTVSIWTAAQPSWLELFLAVLDKHDATLRPQFLFTWTWEHVTKNCVRGPFEFKFIKDLPELWNHPRGKEAGMTSDNVVLLDDYAALAIGPYRDNTCIVSKWTDPSNRDDTELPRVFQELTGEYAWKFD